MERENKGDGNTILLTVIGVATLLVALVGATFAYFSATISNDSNQSVNITTAPPVGLQYIGKQIVMDNIIPGETSDAEQGTFTVTNPAEGKVAQTYDLTLVIDEDTLQKKSVDDTTKELELTITSTTGGISNALFSTATNVTTTTNGLVWDMTDGANIAKSYQFVTDKRIEPGDTQTYVMTLNFIDTNEDQNHNQGKAFRAHVDISGVVSEK